MEQLLAEGAGLAVIAYNVQDDFTNVYSEARAELYGILGLPHVVIDGVQSFDYSYDGILAEYEERIVMGSHYSVSTSTERNGLIVSASVNVGQIGAQNPGSEVLRFFNNTEWVNYKILKD